MKKVLLILFLTSIHLTMFSQTLDFNATYKSAIEMYNRGNYAGARVRFIIAERKANRENNYQGKQQSLEYIDKSDECAQLIKDGERTFLIGEFEIAKRYFDRLSELNPKDPSNLDRSLKCRSEADYLSTKKQADVYFNEKDWSQAYVLYNVCLDSTKSELSSYKRYYTEVQLRNQECLKQINLFNPDSLKIKLKNLKDKFNKKIKDSHGFIKPKSSSELIIAVQFHEQILITSRKANEINDSKRVTI